MSTELMWVGAEGLLEEVFSCDTSIIFLHSRFLYEVKLYCCDVTSNKNVLTWRVSA